MKKIFRLSALFCAMTLLVTSCTKDVVEEQPAPNPEVDGTEIQFGARAGFETTDDTRTVYSGVQYTDKDGKKRERIDWVGSDDINEADWVDIYSPEAKGVNPANYYVTKTTISADDASDGGYLTRLGDGGLQWNAEKETHHFYAMYPSSKKVEGVELKEENGSVYIYGTIPNQQHTQGATTKDANGNVTTSASQIKLYEMAPDMRFAYMAAVGEAKAADGSVSLDFVPVVTAIRIVLTLPESGTQNGQTIKTEATNLFSVRLMGKGIVGDFKANLSKYVNGYPEVTKVKDAEDQAITINLNDENNLPVTLQPGQSLAFTVFVAPDADINLADLKVAFNPSVLESGYKTKALQAVGSVTKVERLKKTSIKGLKLPFTKEAYVVNLSNWMEDIKEGQTIVGLSLPGTGGSFSYAYTGDNPAWYKQQEQPVFTNHELDEGKSYYGKTGQWDLGIRVFEMACDRPEGSTVANPSTLESQPLRVNKQSLGTWNLGKALRALLNKVTEVKDGKASQETAVAIITYQSEGANYGSWSSQRTNNRHAYAFALALKALYNTLEQEYPGKIILYTPNTTLGVKEGLTGEELTKAEANNAEGKLMIICRVNQRNEAEPRDENINTQSNSQTTDTRNTTHAKDNYDRAEQDYQENNIPILLINGCGTAKDRWAARGYTINGVAGTVKDMPGDEIRNAEVSVEHYMMATRSGSSGSYTYTYPDWNAIGITQNGSYNFPTSNGTVQVWYQDWARVVDFDHIRENSGTITNINGTDFYTQTVSSPNSNSYGQNYVRNIYQIRWAESYSEKVNDAKSSFNKAISDKSGQMIYINSLSGYMVQPNIRFSYVMFGPVYNSNDATSSTRYAAEWDGGTAGNIQALAQKLNPAFGGYVRGIISAQGEQGPTGIIMMDYVSASAADGASNYLPQIIIDNNKYTGAFNTSVYVPEEEEPVTPGEPGTPGQPDDEEEG